MDSTGTLETSELRSPLKKLVRFFHGSRDKWKAKCQIARADLKLAKNQVRAVEKSRQVWRDRYVAEAKRRERLERELEELKNIHLS